MRTRLPPPAGIEGALHLDITTEQIDKHFGSHQALIDVGLEIRSGELIALLGPSGSGKTTLLRIIAGLEFPDRGRVCFGGEDASSWRVQQRHVGFVFQNYALFRHMTVFENIAFGLRVMPRAKRPPGDRIKARVEELLELIQLPDIAHRFPAQLSGGQRQRVALARALAIDPTVLLLDEPFGALDARVRKDLRRWLREIHEATGYTTIFVTHDQEEALELADRIVVMSEGRIEQIGTPDEVYHRPQTSFVYGFLGATNVLHGRVEDGLVFLEGFELPFARADEGHRGGTVDVYVRPHDFDIVEERKFAVPGIVRLARSFSGIFRLEVDVPNHTNRITVELPAATPLYGRFAEGDRILLRPRHFALYAADRQAAAGSGLAVAS